MLTGADEWFVHQTPEPLAVAGTDRNFYDRAYLGAFGEDGLLVTVAFGLYPNLGVADAHLSVVQDGKQYCLHVSQTLTDRATTAIGPVRLEIVEPLHEIRVVVEDDELACDLTLTGRHFPIEEPRFIQRVGTRSFMDYTRLSQACDVSGTVTVADRTHRLSVVDGLRDRSWGVRPVGARDPQPLQPPVEPQYFWLWTPVHLPGRTLFWHTKADADGRPWNTQLVLCPHGSGPEKFVHGTGTMALDLEPGTRWVRSATLTALTEDGEQLRLRFRPTAHLEMQGLGYRHPEWAHGLAHGEYRLAREVLDLAGPDPQQLHRWHRQVRCDVDVECGAGTDTARGLLEHLIIGRYHPLGL
ncbi:hypothetical protein GCM10009547_08040 [Sporichthya brevicatena]|uniref:Uncharacterized protein n=1 Tax=Sporichthya brevicatena TaxID=171442 RepID=A0ABP3RJ20_9ACTN